MQPGYTTCGSCHAVIGPGPTLAGIALVVLLIPLLGFAVFLAFALPILGLIIDAGLLWVWYRLFRTHGTRRMMFSRQQVDAAYRRYR